MLIFQPHSEGVDLCHSSLVFLIFFNKVAVNGGSFRQKHIPHMMVVIVEEVLANKLIDLHVLIREIGLEVSNFVMRMRL